MRQLMGREVCVPRNGKFVVKRVSMESKGIRRRGPVEGTKARTHNDLLTGSEFGACLPDRHV